MTSIDLKKGAHSVKSIEDIVTAFLVNIKPELEEDLVGLNLEGLTRLCETYLNKEELEELQIFVGLSLNAIEQDDPDSGVVDEEVKPVQRDTLTSANDLVYPTYKL